MDWLVLENGLQTLLAPLRFSIGCIWSGRQQSLFGPILTSNAYINTVGLISTCQYLIINFCFRYESMNAEKICTSDRLQIVLREISSPNSPNLGRYWDEANMPDPNRANPGTSSAIVLTVMLLYTPPISAHAPQMRKPRSTYLEPQCIMQRPIYWSWMECYSNVLPQIWVLNWSYLVNKYCLWRM